MYHDMMEVDVSCLHSQKQTAHVHNRSKFRSKFALGVQFDATTANNNPSLTKGIVPCLVLPYPWYVIAYSVPPDTTTCDNSLRLNCATSLVLLYPWFSWTASAFLIAYSVSSVIDASATTPRVILVAISQSTSDCYTPWSSDQSAAYVAICLPSIIQIRAAARDYDVPARVLLMEAVDRCLLFIIIMSSINNQYIMMSKFVYLFYLHLYWMAKCFW